MTTLADFLLARIAEDEAVAQAATDGGHGWRLTDLPGANEVWANRDAAGHDAFMIATTATRLNPNPGATGHADAAHIARHDPARVLDKCKADKAIVEECQHAIEMCVAPSEDASEYLADQVLRALASVYADHPDWRGKWGR